MDFLAIIGAVAAMLNPHPSEDYVKVPCRATEAQVYALMGDPDSKDNADGTYSLDLSSDQEWMWHFGKGKVRAVYIAFDNYRVKHILAYGGIRDYSRWCGGATFDRPNPEGQ